MSAPTKLAATLRTAPPSALLGILVLAAVALLALFAPVAAPYGEREIVGDAFEVWSDQFWLGTDNLGRDMLSRLIWGARNTIGMALLTTAIAFVVGAATGLLAGTVGGWADRLLAWIVDVIMAMPSLILALLLLSIFGASTAILVGIIAAIEATRVFRLSRAVAMNISVMEYLDAARLRGESVPSILWREVLPNASAPLVAEFGLRFCFVFLFVSSLSFLGLGIQPPTADWGSMVRDNATLITYGDITPLLPAAAIALVTVSVNLVVDWVLHRSSGLKD
ncbi:ABC transporter permease [Albimonas sp. CAU 1670]|uniref:ABC transporter permease n=1 Tax=Albimonas sp. CAU 1670 TaxID=3032599 RepID=UPI0023DCC3A8|nr:ABC transporter permease [Albimonas sp. CAU 1670]MDF2234770.1 ABC transporter permease [Albimonas sp. CAU 1670]